MSRHALSKHVHRLAAVAAAKTGLAVVHLGWTYVMGSRGGTNTPPMPHDLTEAVRQRAKALFGSIRPFSRAVASRTVPVA